MGLTVDPYLDLVIYGWGLATAYLFFFKRDPEMTFFRHLAMSFLLPGMIGFLCFVVIAGTFGILMQAWKYFFEVVTFLFDIM